MAGIYDAAFAGLDWVNAPRTAPDETVDWFVYVIRLDPTVDRTRLMADLDAHGVPTRPYFSPLHLQPVYQELGHKPGDFPVTERIAASTLAIPFSARLSDEDARYVADAVIEAASAQFRV